jgi:hypothetical protein
MGSHCSFGHLKHKLWPKEGPGVELPGVRQFRLPTSKVRNRPEILGCRKRATYHWKGLDDTYNFASDGISIEGLLRKLWGFKVAGVQSCAILGLPRGSLKLRDFGTPTRESRDKKAIWMPPPRRAAEYTIRGKVVASPKSGPWWVLCVRVARGSS